MSLPPQKFRELVYLALFSEDALLNESKGLEDMLSHELKIAKSTVREALLAAVEIFKLRATYDEEVKNVLIDWELNRLHRSERVLLWLSLHELLNQKLSPKLVLAEAKRIAKKFSMPKATQFIYAVLAAIANKKGLLNEKADLRAAKIEKIEEEEKAAECVDSENAPRADCCGD